MSRFYETPKPTGAAPRTVDGVTFRCFSVGVMLTEWRSEDGRLAAGSSHNHTHNWARVDGTLLPTKFRSLENAMRAAVKAGAQ